MIRDIHGNNNVDSFGNFDFSQGNLEEFEQMTKKVQQKIDEGYFIFKATTDAEGTTVTRTSGSKEVYPPKKVTKMESNEVESKLNVEEKIQGK